MKPLVLLCMLLSTFSGRLVAQPVLVADSNTARMPVLVFLRMSADDAINIEMTENRIRRTLQLLEALKAQYPSGDVKATIYVNGAVSEVLLQRNAQTGVRDLLLAAAKKGLIEIGYDGTNEPRSSDEPLVDYRSVHTPMEGHLARQAVAAHVLTDGRDPVSGKFIADADGGLKRTQQVFGKVASIWGAAVQLRDIAYGAQPDLGSDAEVVQQLRLLNGDATLPGVLEDVPHLDFYYDDWIPVFSKNLTTSADTSPDIYWQENRLRISERSDKPSKVVEATDGVGALKDYLEKLDRSKIRLVQIQIGNDKGFLQRAYQSYLIYPPRNYAMKHPQAPKLPADAFAKEADVAAYFAKQQEAIGYLLGEFVPKNQNSRLVASGDLLKMTAPCAGYRLPSAGLRHTLADLDKSWREGTVLPKYVRVDDHYLSLAQTFQVVADALVERKRTGKLPDSVEVLSVYGPIDMPAGSGAAKGEVSANDVILAAVYIVPAFYENVWSAPTRNAVPGQVQVGKVTVNAAQYLRLMISAFLSDDTATTLTIAPSEMIWGPEAVGIRARPVEQMGTIWTIKPAPLQLPQTAGASRN